MTDDLLTIDDLSVRFPGNRHPAVDRISLRIGRGERVGLIGESGSGKSVTALAVMGLLADNAKTTGSIRWQGDELLGMHDAQYSRLRGEQISMVFQEPMTALDPTMRTGRQVAEVLRLHGGAPAGEARSRVLQTLAKVGIGDPQRVADSFPYQLSGGQRQRVLIAMALINTPDLLICDEPTTALDVTVQARVLELLQGGLDLAGSALLFISHDLAVVSQMVDRIAVISVSSMSKRRSGSPVIISISRPIDASRSSVASGHSAT